jgi:hypothetical protein
MPTQPAAVISFRRYMENSKKRIWKVQPTKKDGKFLFGLAGFEETDPDTMKSTKALKDLTQDDLYAIKDAIHSHLHSED